jgi:hypothetical protein
MVPAGHVVRTARAVCRACESHDAHAQPSQPLTLPLTAFVGFVLDRRLSPPDTQVHIPQRAGGEHWRC